MIFINIKRSQYVTTSEDQNCYFYYSYNFSLKNKAVTSTTVITSL